MPLKNSEAQQKFLETLSAKQPKLEQPITKQVALLESSHHKISMLLSEVLATLTLEGNQHLFEQVPEDWHLLVELWHKRYRKLIATRSETSEDCA